MLASRLVSQLHAGGHAEFGVDVPPRDICGTVELTMCVLVDSADSPVSDTLTPVVAVNVAGWFGVPLSLALAKVAGRAGRLAENVNLFGTGMAV